MSMHTANSEERASVSPVQAPVTGPRVSDSPMARWGGRIGLPIALVALIVIGTFSSPRFLTTTNFLNILISLSIIGVIVVGMTFVFICGGLADLSVPGTVAVGAIVMLEAEGPFGPYLALLAAIVVAGAAGLLNGVLVGYGKGNPIIITLGVGTMLLGLVQALVGGKIVYGTSTSLSRLIDAKVLGVPDLVLIFAVVAVLGHLALSRTVWGRWTYAVGSNYSATEASAVPVRRVKAAAFALTGALAGLGGALLGMNLLSAQYTAGTGYEFDAITAVVVGGTSLLGGRGSIPRAVMGLLLVSILTNVLIMFGVSTPAQGLAQGLLIAIAVGVDVQLRKRAGA